MREVYKKNYKTLTEEELIGSKKVSAKLVQLISLIDTYTIRDRDDFVREPVSADLSWMRYPDLYEDVNNDSQARYCSDKDSDGFLRIQMFLSEINDGSINNKKDSRKNIRAIKENVNSEALKEIVKNLEQAIFGYNEEDNYQESIGERVKTKGRNKISDEEFKKFETGYDDLDNISRMVVGKNFNVEPKMIRPFDGFKNVIDNYKDDLMSKYDF